MGRYVFKLPDVGEGTAEAEITAWHVKVGDVVKEDAPLVDVMTDKATIEITSPTDGTRLIKRGLSVDGRGSVDLKFAPTGVECDIVAGIAA